MFKDVLEPIEVLSHKFDKMWAVLKTLYLGEMSLMPAQIYYPIHNKACMSHITKYNSKPIFEACKVCILFVITCNLNVEMTICLIIFRKLIYQN